MPKETAIGIIPLQKLSGKWKVLLVQLQAGHWGFPKGHPLESETNQDCAVREFKEETGLVLTHWLPIDPFHEQYVVDRHGTLFDKTVTYFAAEVDGQLLIDPVEIRDARWLSLKDAMQTLTFAGTQQILRDLEPLLQ